MKTKKSYEFVLSYVLIYHTVLGVHLSSLRIKISQGEVIGRMRSTETNTNYISFEGIPFAQPPIGALRFKDPVPAAAWNNAFDATEPGSICMQDDDNEIIGHEDCLFLNVYSPVDRTQDAYLPAMVYVHGGCFIGGSGNFLNPDLFIEMGVILVSFNYRLGAFGFLGLNLADVPGNAGMKDQVLALQWVKDNIQLFGGDPENITIFGEGAGGASVHLLQISPMARTLIHRVISISGGSLNTWSLQRRPLDVAALLAKRLELDMDNRNVFLKNLQDLEAHEILRAASAGGKSSEASFAPTVELIFPGKLAFLNMTPTEHYEKLDFAHIPCIIGYTSKEMAVEQSFEQHSAIQTLIEYPSNIIPSEWFRDVSDFGIDLLISEIRTFYFGGQVVDMSIHENFEDAIDLLGDVRQISRIQKLVETLSRSAEPVYFYRFSFRGVLNAPDMDLVKIQGATYGNELALLFPAEEPRLDYFSSDGWIRRRLIRLFTNFAKTGNPTPDTENNLLPVKWIPAEEHQLNYLEIDGQITPSINPDSRRMRFWKNLEKRVHNGEF